MNLFLASFLILVAVANAQCPHAMGALQGERTFKMVTTTTILPVSSKSPTYHSKVTDTERHLVRSVMKMVRYNGNIAPKVFIRYFRAKPESLKLFPTFANVPLNDLPRNAAFLSNAYTCMAALYYYVQNTGTADPATCTYLARATHKYEPKDIELLNSIIMAVLEEDLGGRFTSEAKVAFKKGLDIMMEVVTKRD